MFFYIYNTKVSTYGRALRWLPYYDPEYWRIQLIKEVI